jgi:pimeloyl-ACP methyl ester carboxylesterase
VLQDAARRLVMSAQYDESCVLLDGDGRIASRERQPVPRGRAAARVVDPHAARLPEFWGAWRHQLTALAGAGFRAVAVDLRGHGASDKPPRGYDGYTMAADVTGLIRALGERTATVVGTGYGGLVAWTVEALYPRLVRRLIVVSAPHPLRLRSAAFADLRGQLAVAGPVLKFQLPRYEHVLTRDDAARIGEYLRAWSGPEWRRTQDFAEYERACRSAFQIPQVAFCSLEAFRWGVRSLVRPHGLRRWQLRSRVEVDTCLQGALTRWSCPPRPRVPALSTPGTRLLDRVGHFPHREALADHREILRWAMSNGAGTAPRAYPPSVGA